jgi:Carbohydrate family 9 binding domain-like
MALKSGVAAGALLLLAGTASVAQAATPSGMPAAEAGNSFLRPAMDMEPAASPGSAPLLRPALGAQPQSPGTAANPVRDFTTYMPTAKATRIEASEAPIVDGDLSDPVWQRAEAITEFYQLDPNEGQPASERTDVRFLYDTNNLYVYIYAYDRRPELIRGTSMNRDGNFGGDDTVRVYLDPLNTRRNGYQFVLNSLGGRIDQLIQNNSDFIREWNTIWTGKAKVVADGWTVELAIPFRDLSFDPTKPDWVIEFTREIRHLNERDRWSSVSAATLSTDISRSGTLTGITDINQGLGLDIQLYGAMRYRFDWQQPQRETKSARLSGNAFYKITPQLTGTLTVNPDFSDSPLDLLQVNTTRFNLFQPETRNFFLQDAATFEFGGRNFAATTDYNYPPENGSPFFSRNLGLANGVPVSIIGGTKLSGEYGGLGIGALSVVTNGTGDTKRSQVLSIARVTKTIGESKAGIMFTNGDPSGRSKNTLAGADFQYRNSNFQPGKVLLSDFYYVRSMSDTKGDDDSFGAALNLPNEPWGLETRLKQIGTNYTPALGFENRTGIRQFDGIAQYRRRDLSWRWLDVASSWYFVTDLSNHLESRENGIWTGVSLRSTDELYVRAFDNYEDVPASFNIAGKVPVPAGQYHWTNGSIYIQTSSARPIFGRLDVLCCNYYNGHQVRASLRLDMRPNAMFQLAPRYTYTYLDLPGGLLNIHALATDFITNFTPDMQLYTELQYDNVSQKFALSIRYRWEYEPGQEIFASVGQSALIPGQEFSPRTTQTVLRLGHTFRY